MHALLFTVHYSMYDAVWVVSFLGVYIKLYIEALFLAQRIDNEYTVCGNTNIVY